MRSLDSRRPDRFELKRSHHMSDGVLFAMLGNGIGVGTNLAYDSSADFGRIGNHGTLTNMLPSAWVWWPELNRYANIFSSDYTGRAIVVPDADDFTPTGSGFSVSAWVNLNSVAAANPIVDKYITQFEWVFGFTGGELYCWLYDIVGGGYNGRFVSDVASYITAGVWSNIVWTFSGIPGTAGHSLYIDGIRRDNGNFNAWSPVLPTNGNCTVGIGRANIGCGGAATGQIADVLIYKLQLSETAVAMLANRADPTYNGWIQSLRGWVPGMAVAGGGISQAIGQVSETDSQSALSKIKEKSVALQTETDSVLAVTAAKSVAIAIQTETDSSSALTSAKSAAIAIQTETDEALPLGAVISLAIGQVSETDSVFAITSAKEKAVGLVSETDSLFSLSAGLQANISQVSETDSPLAFTSAKTKAIGLQTETDEGFSFSASKSYTIGQASETDAILALAAKLKAKSIGLVASVELSLPFATGLLSKGVEFRAPDTRLHFRAPDTRLHFLA